MPQIGQVLAEIEHRERRLTHRRVEPVGLIELALGLLGLPFQVGRLRREHALIDRAVQVAVEQPLLHVRQLAPALGERLLLSGPGLRDIVERGVQRVAEPHGDLRRWQADRVQLADNGRLDVSLLPPDARVVRILVVVAAAVIDVRVVTAPLELLADAFAGHGVAARATPEQAAGVRQIGIARASVTPVQHVLACLERAAVNQQAILAREYLTVAVELADVKAVVEDVRERRSVKPRLAVAEDVQLALQLVGEALEGVLPAGVQLEDTGDRPALLGMRDDGLGRVVGIDVTVRGEARRPSLANLLVHALEHFGAKVVRVVLRHRRHDVERQRASGAGAELVLDEHELDAAGVLQLLQADRVPHIATGAVELVAEDRADALTAGIRLDPREHLVERRPVDASLGRLGDRELAGDGPAGLGRPVAHGADLRVDRVPLPLLA